MKKYLFLFSFVIFFFIPTFVHAEGCQCDFTITEVISPCIEKYVTRVLPYEVSFFLADIIKTITPSAEGDGNCTTGEIQRFADRIGQWTGIPRKTEERSSTCGMEIPETISESIDITCRHVEDNPNYGSASSTMNGLNGSGKLAEPQYVQIPNPLKGNYSIQQLMGLIVNRFMGILGSITLVVFVYGGFMFLTAAGNDEKVKKGTSAMLYAAIGLFIIFGAYVILNMVLGQVLGV